MGKKQERDFKKVKAKGYGKNAKRKPQNVVKTSFRTKALMMPYQKITDQARLDREEVTRRNLSLDELMSRVSHHNGKVRRDTFLGLRELVTSFPIVLDMRIGPVLSGVLGAMQLAGENEKADEALVKAFGAIVEAIPEGQLEPHGLLVWAYVSSALTHLNSPVRLVGLRVLDHCLNCGALFAAIDQHALLQSFAAILGNKFNAGLSLADNRTRMAIWRTVLHFQDTQAQVEGDSDDVPIYTDSPFPWHRLQMSVVKEGRSEVQQSVTSQILPVLLNDLFETIPGPNAEFANVLLESLMLMLRSSSGAKVEWNSDMHRALQHLAGCFPLGALEGHKPAFVEANIKVCFLLLTSQKFSWIDSIAKFVAERLSDGKLEPQHRQLLLEGCQSVWSLKDLGGKSGSMLASSFVQFLESNASVQSKLDCADALTFFMSLCKEGQLLERMLVACARILWKSNAPSVCQSDTLTAFIQSLLELLRHCKASQLLTDYCVPVMSVEMGERVHFGAFRHFGEEQQNMFVRLFSGLDCAATDGLKDAWIRLFADEKSHDSACFSLLFLLHQYKCVIFLDVADYLNFLGRILFRVPNRSSITVIVARHMADAWGSDWEEVLDKRGGMLHSATLNVMERPILSALQSGVLDRECAAVALVTSCCFESHLAPLSIQDPLCRAVLRGIVAGSSIVVRLRDALVSKVCERSKLLPMVVAAVVDPGNRSDCEKMLSYFAGCRDEDLSEFVETLSYEPQKPDVVIRFISEQSRKLVRNVEQNRKKAQ